MIGRVFRMLEINNKIVFFCFYLGGGGLKMINVFSQCMCNVGVSWNGVFII